jgi:hypothetical protein
MNWYQQFKIQHGFKLSLILVGSEIWSSSIFCTRFSQNLKVI